MPTQNPRVNVTFSPSDAEVMQLICNKKKISMSGLIRKVVEDWLEEYEDMILAKRAEEADREWMEGGCKTISQEDLCRKLGIELNMDQKQTEIFQNSPKTYRKGLSRPSIKGSRSRRKKSENL